MSLPSGWDWTAVWVIATIMVIVTWSLACGGPNEERSPNSCDVCDVKAKDAGAPDGAYW